MWHQLLPPELLINFWPGYVPNRLSAEASPQTPLGELKALPQTPSCIKGPTSKGGEGRGREGKGGDRKGREGRGGAATSTFAPGGTNARAASAF